MFDYYWRLLNEWFGHNPFALTIAVISFYVIIKSITKGIPALFTKIIKSRKKYKEQEEQKVEYEKKEAVEKEKSRNTLHEINGNIKTMTGTIKVTNGKVGELTETLKTHTLNSRIHVDITELVSEKQCLERKGVLEGDIKEVRKKVFDGKPA